MKALNYKKDDNHSITNFSQFKHDFIDHFNNLQILKVDISKMPNKFY